MFNELLEIPSKALKHTPFLTEEMKQFISTICVEASDYVSNVLLKDLLPHQVILVTLISLILLKVILVIFYAIYSFRFSYVKIAVFKFAVKWIPQAKAYVEKEKNTFSLDCKQKYSKQRQDGKALIALPEKGASEQSIIQRVKDFVQLSKKYYSQGGNISGGVYINDESHWNFISDVMKETIVSNPLHMDEFKYTTQQEAEIIRWTLNLYNGDKNACGIVTSGGTESIILSLLAYKEKAKAERGVTQPNVVCSYTAHPAFDKGAFYFGIELRKVPVTSDTLADLDGMSKLIDKNTICLVASAPEYPYGNYDPVEKIAELAQKWGIGCHSDCCLGSFVNPFVEELGYKLPYKYDFRVPGVTSISCDPHKYAYGPKGCSILLFREKRLREYQFFVVTDWNGGLYGTTCIAGSRPGNVIAGTWASMLKLGRQGLKEKARGILEAQRQIIKELENDPDFQVLTINDGPIIAFTSKTVNAIAVGDEMSKRHNWQISKLQNPAGGHLAITDANQSNWKHFVSSLRECAQAMKADKSLNKNHTTALYAMTGSIPDKGLLHEFVSIHQAHMLDTLDG